MKPKRCFPKLLALALIALPLVGWAQSFPLAALSVAHSIDWRGNDVLVDSFDSADPNYSTGGLYDPAKAKANGTVLANGSIITSISTGNAHIYGHVHVGPGGTVAIGNLGGIGTQAWQAAHPGQIEPGYFSNDAACSFPELVLPYSTGMTPTSGTTVVTNCFLVTNAVVTAIYPDPAPAGGVVTNLVYITTNTWPGVPNTVTNCSSTLMSDKNFPPAGSYCPNPAPWQVGGGRFWCWYGIAGYAYAAYTYRYNLYTTNCTFSTNYYDQILESGNYVLGTPLSGKTLVRGNARLVVPNGINMGGSDRLEIASQGSLVLFVGGTACTLGGHGILNQSGLARNCAIFCTPSVITSQINIDGQFIGLFVAPRASTWVSVSSASSNDFIGALMAGSLGVNGRLGFHFDESLLPRARLSSPFWSSSHDLFFTVTGTPDVSYAVEASVNLRDWVSLATNISPFYFMDSVTNFPQRYYRAVRVP